MATLPPSPDWQRGSTTADRWTFTNTTTAGTTDFIFSTSFSWNLVPENVQQRVARVLSGYDNAEERRGLAEELGRNILDHVQHGVLDKEGEDRLVMVVVHGREIPYLFLTCPSTGGTHLIKVPPHVGLRKMRRVRQAKAWTFGLPEAEYAPMVET